MDRASSLLLFFSNKISYILLIFLKSSFSPRCYLTLCLLLHRNVHIRPHSRRYRVTSFPARYYNSLSPRAQQATTCPLQGDVSRLSSLPLRLSFEALSCRGIGDRSLFASGRGGECDTDTLVPERKPASGRDVCAITRS